MDVKPDAMLELTPIDQFRIPTYRAELPSGRVVRIRPLNLMIALMNGSVPNDLLPKVQEMLDGKMPDLDGAGALDVLPLARWVAKSVLIYPVLWDGQGKAPENAAPYEALKPEDYMALTEWALTETTAPFRGVSEER